MTPSKNLRLLILSLSAVVLAPACMRQEAPAPVAPPVAKAPPVAVAPSSPTAPAPPAAPAPAPEMTTKDANAAAYAGYIAELEQTLNDFLGEYIRKNKRTPKDIGEMMSLGIITSIPPAPAGKKWVIDQRTGKIAAK